MADPHAPSSSSNSGHDLYGLPFDAGTMFSNHKGVFKPRIEKRQRALAEKVSFLKDFLEPDEQILLLTTAISPTSFFEQWTTGYAFFYIRRCLLVVTTKRIFHIPTTVYYRYRQSIAQIRYGDIETIVQKGNRLKIRYKSGDKDLFLYLRRAERKKMRALLTSLDLHGTPSKAGKRVHLCPRCSAELQTDVFRCSTCRLEFKSREQARKRSIWIPGGGYFYTGHPLLGIGDALVESMLIILLVLSLLPDQDLPNGEPVVAAVFAVVLVIEKLVSVYHANHFVKEFLTEGEVKRSVPT